MTAKGLGLWFAVLLALSLHSRWQVPGLRAGRCSLDGNRILPAYRVDLVTGPDERASRSFCCIRCALEWPELPPDAAWHVRDEISGRPLDSRKACFVESSVVTVPSRRDHRHAFENWPDAMEHIARHGGERIPDPFGKLYGHVGTEERQDGERDDPSDRDGDR